MEVVWVVIVVSFKYVIDYLTNVHILYTQSKRKMKIYIFRNKHRFLLRKRQQKSHLLEESSFQQYLIHLLLTYYYPLISLSASFLMVVSVFWVIVPPVGIVVLSTWLSRSAFTLLPKLEPK